MVQLIPLMNQHLSLANDAEQEVRKGIETIAKQFEPKTVKTSGTLRKLKQQL